ncbi:ATP-binding protein [Halomonas sp. HMF6819]|uniref:sensor histidine kinase n=1 Tax=Halomonas sp. HMF6819 TaxID=3373085 RepID=UPI0037B3EC53
MIATWRLPTLHELGCALLFNALALLASWGLYTWLALANLSLVFLSAVLACAVLASRFAALISALLGFLTFNFFFTVPTFSLIVAEREQLLTLCFFLLIALVVGNVASESRRRLSALSAARLAEEQERLRSALLASVSHDLRTPLSSIIGAASSLRALDAQLSDSDRRALLDSVLGESERLDRYIQNLLDMTRLGHGELKIERDWISLDDLIATVRRRLAGALQGLTLELRFAPGNLPLLYVHPALIEQALVNVLENAARFSPPGGVIEILAFTDDAATSLTIAMTDQGPGIEPERREKVFDMFYTGGDRSPHGSGLGLAICKGMVGAHGGQVRAEANPEGQGTRIVITLPLYSPTREARDE